jgi:uncharacterized protein
LPNSDTGRVGTDALVGAADTPSWLTATADGVTIEVKAVPRSRRTQAVGVQDGRLRVQIAAPPHDGQSNAALCAYLAEAAGVRPQAASIRRGSGGARKLVTVEGDPATLVPRLVREFAGLGSGT